MLIRSVLKIEGREGLGLLMKTSSYLTLFPLSQQAKRCSILSCISIMLLASVSQACILKDRGVV